MSNQQRRSINPPDQSTACSAGVPSCLWVLLGVGTVVLLVGAGLLLAWIPTSRKASIPTDSLTETAAPTRQPLPEDKHTPSTISSLTPTPPTGLDYLEGGSNPDLLLLVTPDSQSGVIYPDTYLHADAGNYSLQPGQMVTLHWDGYPITALSYHFFLKPHAGGSYQFIGIDLNSEDGVAVEWLVPENLAGDLYGIAIYEDGRVEAAFISAAVYSGTGNGSSHAVNVLKEYFRTLSQGEYKAASDLFGGDYSILEEYNPDLDPYHRAGLLQRACQTNGFVCLPVHEVLSIEPDSSSSFNITVNFMTDEGIFLGQDGCCGETPSEEPQTAFTYRVAKDPEGYFLVMDLPVYIP